MKTFLKAGVRHFSSGPAPLRQRRSFEAVSPGQAGPPDLAAWQERAERFGHSLGNLQRPGNESASPEAGEPAAPSGPPIQRMIRKIVGNIPKRDGGGKKPFNKFDSFKPHYQEYSTKNVNKELLKKEKKTSFSKIDTKNFPNYNIMDSFQEAKDRRHGGNNAFFEKILEKQEAPETYWKEVAKRNDSHDTMTLIQGGLDKRDGGNNQLFVKPDLNEDLTRYDDFPLDSKQPMYRTPKSHIGKEGLKPTGNESSKTTAFGHVHGKQKYKKDSPYTSFSSSEATGYGGYKIATHTGKLHPNDVLDQFDIQRDIRLTPDPEALKDAINMDGKKWQPDEGQRKRMPKLGINPNKELYNFGERARSNSDRDDERLVTGTVGLDKLNLFSPDGNKLAPEEIQEQVKERNKDKKKSKKGKK